MQSRISKQTTTYVNSIGRFKRNMMLTIHLGCWSNLEQPCDEQRVIEPLPAADYQSHPLPVVSQSIRKMRPLPV